MTTAIRDLIKRGVAFNYFRCSIKRVTGDGTYDADWIDITDYVLQYPSISTSYSDVVFLGDYRIDAGQLVLNNSTRRFNDPTDSTSIFYSCLTRYRTRIKIECGFKDDDETEVDGLVFHGIVFSEPISTDGGYITFSVASILKVFQNYTAYDVSTAGAPSSATMIDRLVKLESGGVRLFDRYLEGTTDAERYQINPDSHTLTLTAISQPSVQADNTVWDKIADYSFAEGFFPEIDPSGNFVWDKRTETATTQWVFNGAGSQDSDYGINIISVDRYSDGTNNIWTRFAITYDNNGNVSVAEDSWTPGDLSNTDVYGARTYAKTMLDLDITTSAAVATALQADYKNAHKELDITTVFIPHLRLNDRVEVNYIGQASVANTFTIGVSRIGGPDLLGHRVGSISIDGLIFKIIGISHDINMNSGRFCSKFTLREVLS